MEKELYRIPEVCERYSISRSSLYRDIKAGKLKLVKRGKSSLVARTDIQVWAESFLKNNQRGQK